MHRINPNIDINEVGIENVHDAIPGRGYDVLFWFRFGAYADTNVFVWKGEGGLGGALEEAASWLAENDPDHFHEVEDKVDETDMTYTESGYLASREWEWSTLYPGNELFNKVWEATIDWLAEEEGLDDDDIEKVNKFARKYKIDAQWLPEEENPRHGPRRHPATGRPLDSKGKNIAIGDRVILPDGEIERVLGFEDDYVIHGHEGQDPETGWRTRARYTKRR